MSKSNTMKPPKSMETETENENENISRNRTPFPLPSTASFSSSSSSRSPLNTIPDPCQYEYTSERKSTTPARLSGLHKEKRNSAAVSRVSNVNRPLHINLVRGGGGGSVCRGNSLVVNSEASVVPHFELLQDPSFWKDHNVQVLIRIRPLSNLEKVSQGYGTCLKQESAQTLVWLGHPETRFTFDHVACQTISQDELFRVAGLPMVDNCMSGYNSCMFAYGQTGSGKTYTMMGEIGQVDGKLDEHCGITPRIFQYLFTRIREEEENRRTEGLKYSCKCSFLEIYNEQITDLLEPSSTNLQLREDLNKGVYVENLSEYDVRSANDVITLLREGAANRKMAATHMNSESSRSHSVFTCIIESRWEKDSMNLLRFARLNLVDLAGSERQKSSGAEGDRLKEAANINKSLSTLGLVIMSLVDLAHGKQRHVPYRDSRLTFLLQDSLGGNSKTTIIANVSPSICSANETLSTLKFAQRAKLIQNNAKVNEDASGDVTALQLQIQLLKGQLNFLMKHQNPPKQNSNCLPSMEESHRTDFLERCDSFEKITTCSDDIATCGSDGKVKSLKTSLLGALRREKLAEMEARRLKTELEQTNCLVHQQEEDAERTKMMLTIQEERIKRLELCADGLLSADKHLVDENNALREEIQVLQARKNRNPDITKFELENVRLLQQLKLFQDFYEQGERETLLAELSELRDQFLELLEAEGSYWQPQILPAKDKQSNVGQELEECRDMNSRLIREADELQRVLDKHMKCNQDEFDSVQALSIESDQLDDRTCYNLPEDRVLLSKKGQIMDSICVWQYKDIQKQLVDARFLMEKMESKQVRLIEELEFMREENHRLTGILNKKEMKRQPGIKRENYSEQRSFAESQHLDLETLGSEDVSKVALQAKLDKLSEDLQEALSLNSQYLEDHASRLSQDQKIELVRDEVEVETAKTILYLQEELVALQSEFEERLCTMAEENAGLRKTLAAKDDEIRALSAEWERAILELTSFLLDGSKSLRDASSQIEGIASLFPHVNVWIGEHVERAAKICTQKEETILLLQHSLKDAQKTVLLMDQKLNSLKGATIALTEVEQLENDVGNEVSWLMTVFDGDSLEKKVKCNEDHNAEAEKCADAACSAVKMIHDHPAVVYRHNLEGDMPLTDVNALASTEVDIVAELERQAQLETEDALNAFCSDAETYLSALKSDIQEAVFIYKDLLQDLVNDIREARRNCSDLKANGRGLAIHTFGVSSDSHKLIKHENQQLLHQMKDELVKTNDRLNTVNVYFYKMVNSCGSPEREEDSGEAVRLSTDCSTSCSNHSADCVALGSRSNKVCFNGYECPGRTTALDLEFEERLIVSSHSHESEKLDGQVKSLNDDELIVCLRKEFKSAYGVFSKLNAQFDGFFTEKDGDCYAASLSFPEPLEVMMDDDPPITPEMRPTIQCHDLMTQKANASCNNTRKLDAGDKLSQANSFFTKIEDAHATMKEADDMLKALLKANENAKHLSFMWKQAGEELQFEKASLIQEIQQLKSSIATREGENGVLQDHIYYGLTEIANSIALLEGAFEYMQKDVEEFCKVAYFDALNVVKETLNWICSSKVMLEEIFTKAMENEITSVFLECHVKDFIYKFRSINTNYALCPVTLQCEPLQMKNDGESYMSCEDHSMVNFMKWAQDRDETATVRGSEAGELSQVHGDPENENLELKRELERKDVLLKGLLFDFSLLQESASSRQDFKDEFKKLITTLNQVQYELHIKTSELDDLLLQYRALEDRLSETENALTIAKSDLEHATGTSNILSEQNADLRVLLKDLYLKKSEAEEQLEEQKEVVKSLEEEILRMASSTERQLASSVKEDDLKRVTEERDKLLEQLQSLQVRLDMAFALADENEAIAVEARQESETSKMYAEQKEEEVKILERSVEELECTINVLEKKVYGMEDEVQRQHLIRDSLELEIQALTERLSMVENLTENLDFEDSNMELSKGQIFRSLEVHETQSQIRILEEEKEELVKEIKQYKEYISELVLHAEAQASQYQEKYKYLEAMVHEVKTDLSNVTYGVPTLDKTEKTSTRARGSGSPFRCITNLVQQMNLEKDQELSMAKVRIEELEALAASKQKEVCVLSSRLAAAESMTHDVIRDLLGVKLDMTNYANLADEYQLQKLVEEAQQRKQENVTMEKEILNLRRQVVDLTEEREQCILEVNRRETDMLAAQLTLEQLKERDQMLTAQNEMLKMDKTNLQRRIAELDDMMKKLFGTQDTKSRNQQSTDLWRGNSSDLSQRLNHPGKQLLRVDDLLARPRRLNCTNPHSRRNGDENETKFR